MRSVHLPGVENRVADWLSRWDKHRKYQDYFNEYIREDVNSYVDLKLTRDIFKFSGQI